jgi:hypothetical protein
MFLLPCPLLVNVWAGGTYIQLDRSPVVPSAVRYRACRKPPRVCHASRDNLADYHARAQQDGRTEHTAGRHRVAGSCQRRTWPRIRHKHCSQYSYASASVHRAHQNLTVAWLRIRARQLAELRKIRKTLWRGIRVAVLFVTQSATYSPL